MPRSPGPMVRQLTAPYFRGNLPNQFEGASGTTGEITNFAARADNVDPFLVHLSWDALNTALFYEWEVSTDNGSTYAKMGTNSYVLALDIDNNTVANPTGMDGFRDPNQSVRYRVRALKNDYTYTDWSTSGEVTTTDIASAVTVGSTGDFATLQAAADAHVSGTSGQILILEDLGEYDIAINNHGQGNDNRLIIAAHPNLDRVTIDGTGSGADTRAIDAFSANTTYRRLDVSHDQRQVIRHGTDQNGQACSNVTFDDLIVETSSVSTNDPGCIYLGREAYFGTPTENILTRNCVVNMPEAFGVQVDARDTKMINSLVEYCSCDSSSHGLLYVKYATDNFDANLIGRLCQSTARDRSIMSDLSYGRWYHFLLDRSAVTTDDLSHVYVGINHPSANQIFRHFTLLNNKYENNLAYLAPETGDGIQFHDFLLAENASTHIQNYSNNTITPPDWTTSYLGDQTDLVDYANGDYNVDSNSPAYRAASSGMDYGALIPGCGPTRKGIEV